MLRLIELFAGIGAQAKALENLGIEFEHYRAVEFDKYAITSYNAIHGTNFEISDITAITAEDLGITDTDAYTYLLTYSFPCQDLSVAGKKQGMEKGSGTRSGLLWEVERLLSECKELPQILLMENVTQVHGKKNKPHFDKWCAFLESKGYHSYWQDLNSKHYGIPQNRNRCFMVSILSDKKYEFPKPVTLEKVLLDLLEPESDIDERFYNVSHSMLRALKSGSVADVTNRKYSNAITTRQSRWSSAGMVCIGKPRYFTPLECFRFMGFADGDFYKAQQALNEKYYRGKIRSDSQLYKQAGNSIVVNVLENIFKNFIDILK